MYFILPFIFTVLRQRLSKPVMLKLRWNLIFSLNIRNVAIFLLFFFCKKISKLKLCKLDRKFWEKLMQNQAFLLAKITPKKTSTRSWRDWLIKGKKWVLNKSLNKIAHPKFLWFWIIVEFLLCSSWTSTGLDESRRRQECQRANQYDS